MAVFDELPAPLRDAINYAPEPLDPKALAALCRRHGAGNVLAMIELKLRRAAGQITAAPSPALFVPNNPAVLHDDRAVGGGGEVAVVRDDGDGAAIGVRQILQNRLHVRA